MATYSSRMGLVKPAGSEPRAPGPINTNSDLLDKFMPCILVNDGVTPPTGDLYDGALVKERTSGIIWEARKNGGGTFDKVYVRYPFAVKAYRNGATSTTSGTTYQVLGYDTVVTADCKNSSLANFSSTRLVLPVKGLWGITISGQFGANATGMRALSVEINSSVVLHQQDLRNASSLFETTNWISWTQNYAAGTTVCGTRWQNSGGAVNVDGWYIYAVLVEPTQ